LDFTPEEELKKKAGTIILKSSQKLLVLTGILSGAFAWTSFGQSTVSTPVVGFEKIDLPANSFTSVGVNFNNTPVLSATVSAVSGGAITLSGVTNAGASLNSAEPYYIEVTSGTEAGTRLNLDVAATIAAANASVTVAPASSNNTATLASVASALPGVSVQIKKHITLADIGANITGLTAGASGTGDEILFLDPATGGFRTYLRRSSTTWRDENNITVNTTPIPPGVGFIVNKRAVAGSIISTGTIRGNNFHLNTVPGYQLVTFGFPINHSPTSLGAVGTSSSPAAGWTSGQANVADSIYAINTAGGFNQYFLRTGSSWRDGNNVTVNTTEIMPSGASYVIYKNGALNLELVKPSGL